MDIAARWAGISLTMALCSLSGCQSGIPDPTSALPLRHVSVQELVTLLNQRSEHIRGLRALLQLQARGNIIPIRRSMSMSLSYIRPALIRLRAFDPLGRTVFDLTSNSMRFRAHLPTHNRVVTGTRTAPAIDTHPEAPSTRTRMLHLITAISEAVLAMPIDDTSHLTLHEDGSLYRIAIPSDTHSTQPARHLWVERINLDVVKEDVFNDRGNLILTITFDDYRFLGPDRNVPYPFLVAIHDVEANSHYTLTFQEVILNPDVSPNEFENL